MNKKIKSITETGIFVALAVLLDLTFKMISFLKMPSGGSVSIAMLPIILNGYRNNTKWGIIGGITYAVINFILDGFFWHLGSIFFDYLFAFGLLGLSGLFKSKSDKIFWYLQGIFICCFIRYISHGLSGFIFFKASDVSYGYGLFYSFILYNGPYMLISTILCMIVAVPLHKLVIKNN